MSSSQQTAVHTQRGTASELVRIGAATAAAVVVNLLILWAGSAAGASLEIDAPYDLNAAAVALSTAMPMLAASALVVLLARRYPAARRWFAWAGAAFALLTAAMPFTVAEDTATAVTLALMHLVAGTAWLTAIMPRPTTR
ncbi:DUF6069 family protein [Phytohabitans rumicis]|uniref:Uncharacterized protein n=1 Tax=Phytohabitans rumicis TaxID=1076125 RepID=A0A6V8L0E7_9ACTN|nr:DUF6069 family protein [Phytohabitans rumicis]GFJ87567.1 hypothetical protein Prum_012090 [Phytohabitans rumicis]